MLKALISLVAEKCLEINCEKEVFRDSFSSSFSIVSFCSDSALLITSEVCRSSKSLHLFLFLKSQLEGRVT